MTAPLPFPVLEALIAPLDVPSFFEKHWESRVLLLHGGTPQRVAFQESSWRELAAAALQNNVRVEILGAGKVEPAQDLAAAEEALSRGKSLRIYHAQRCWAVADRFCRELSLELSHSIGANVYITPSGEKGLHTHVDDHDVFVVQIQGRKRWSLFGETYPLPLGHRPPLIFEQKPRTNYVGMPHGAHSVPDGRLGPPQLETVLSPGDLFYLPRGTVHRAAALDSDSVHVTLGVHVARWADLLAEVVARAALGDVELRRALPPGFARVSGADSDVKSRARERLLEIAEKQDGRDALEEVVARFLIAARGEEKAAEPAAAPDDDPSDDDVLRLAPDLLIARRDDAVALRRFDRRNPDFFVPAIFESALLDMASRPSFRIRELQKLTRASNRALVKHLYKSRAVVRVG